ncbi:hypothetical protein [Marinicella gelatinilytica]|uniref:hypothetical protein n=1 Tax=Marinicella gelatinilytica TaxID=2996017 RepID=UPI002260E3BA|nr:hypothetical protein [Marinicella gelatinilytica]MCX7544781.1 hypothetical protein [Marinicella gelatinilytica]
MINKQRLKRFTMEVLCLLLICTSYTLWAENPQFRLSGLDIKNQSEQTVITVDKLFMAPDIIVDNINYQCQGSIAVYPSHHCQQANLAFDLQQNRLQLTGQVHYDVVNQILNIDAVDSDNTMVLSYDSARQRQNITLNNLPIKKWLPPLFTAIKNNLSANANGDVSVNLDQGIVESINGIEFMGLDYEHSDDLIALGLNGTMNFIWDMSQQNLTAELVIAEGEALLKQVYINFSEFPLILTLNIDMSHDQYLINWGLAHQTAFQASGEFNLNSNFDFGLWQLRLEINDSAMVNKHIANSVLEIYGFSKNQANGGFILSVTGEHSRIDHIVTDFKDFSFINEKRKLAIIGLQGKVDWQWHQVSQPSNVSWQSLSLSGLPMSAATMNFNLSEDVFSLYGRHQFPIFDGALVIDRLIVSDFMAETPASVKMDAEIEPISLLPISEALNWPELAGQISGQLPGMVKSGNVIEFAGTLHLSVFDGSIRFENLSMERLFGVAPVVAADVDIDMLDLALLTKTYDFGLITGRLSGNINHLRITNWKVDRMDATIYSVAAPSTKQTISQRAIENISAIGGIKGALSRTFLRFFEQFKYKKIMLSCRLHNSVCQIGGLDNQDGRFTIIEGGGLPKINIVGYAREIDWDVFISRLLNASYDS